METTTRIMRELPETIGVRCSASVGQHRAAPRLRDEFAAQGVEVPGLPVPLPAPEHPGWSGEVAHSVRPERVRVVPDAGETPAGAPRVTGTVREVPCVGGQVRILPDLPGGHRLVAARPAGDAPAVAPGDEVATRRPLAGTRILEH